MLTVAPVLICLQPNLTQTQHILRPYNIPFAWPRDIWKKAKAHQLTTNQQQPSMAGCVAGHNSAASRPLWHF